MKLGKQVLNGSTLVYVGTDRQGHFFTFSSDGSGQRIRLSPRGGGYVYTLLGVKQSHSAQFTDVPEKSRV